MHVTINPVCVATCWSETGLFNNNNSQKLQKERAFTQSRRRQYTEHGMGDGREAKRVRYAKKPEHPILQQHKADEP